MQGQFLARMRNLQYKTSHFLYCSRCRVCPGSQYLENKARICVSTSSWTGSGYLKFPVCGGARVHHTPRLQQPEKAYPAGAKYFSISRFTELNHFHWRDSIVLCVPDRGKEYPSWVISLPESCHRRVPECQQQAKSCRSELVLGVALGTAETDSPRHGHRVHLGMGKKRKTYIMDGKLL